MNPSEFLKTIYLGDRACKAILIDSWKKQVAFQINTISRLRPGTNTWAFYTGGDINDGWLVFNDVTRIQFEPSGPLPNDLVNDFSVRQDASTVLGSDYLFELSISSVDSNGK